MASNIPTMSTHESITYTCVSCDSKSGVQWYCNDCREALCHQCKEFHLSGRRTKNDEIVSILKANHQGDKRAPEVCKPHPGKLCNVYCCDCDMLMCRKCFCQTHKLHKWKHFEDESNRRKQLLEEHIQNINSKISYCTNRMSKWGCAEKAFSDTIDSIRTDVSSQTKKMKTEVDSVADEFLADLAFLEKEELPIYQKHYQQSAKNIRELTRLLEKAKMTDTWSVSMIETEKSLRATLPSYDVDVEDALPKPPSFATGHVNRLLVTKMVGELNNENQNQKIEIGSRHVQSLSKFVVHQENHILGICPVDNRNAWLSINHYKGLDLVNREGVVSETIKLDFCPYRIAMVGTTGILMSIFPPSTCIYKLSLLTTQVSTFADIKLCKAIDLSVNRLDEVVVLTDTSDVVVLDPSGTIVRIFRCGINGWQISCLSSGDIAVAEMSKVSILADTSGTTKYQWSGELSNDLNVRNMICFKMSCDQHRLFIPDYKHNMVYVLRENCAEATCILDKRDGVVSPTIVVVDMYGKLWIGCGDGTVHIMRL